MTLKFFKLNVISILLFSLIVAEASEKECALKCPTFWNVDDCIEPHMICDGTDDCDNKEDEEDCDCKGFTCTSDGICIDASKRCNGHFNCDDFSDENNCTKNDYKSIFPALENRELCKRPCGKHGFCSFTSNGASICVCDTAYTGSFCEQRKAKFIVIHSEVKPTSKPVAKFSCGNREISMEHVCDGKAECDDGKDEYNCSRKDYERAKPLLSHKLICLMPCENGRCVFDELDRASCACHDNYNGKFCENKLDSLPRHPLTPTIEAVSDLERGLDSELKGKPSLESRTTSGSEGRTTSASEGRTTLDSEEKLTSKSIESTTGKIESTTISENEHNEASQTSNDFVSTIALPVIGVGAVGVLLWIVIVKPWSSAQNKRGERTLV